MKIGFIGLGQMGSAMCARLLEQGHDLFVWNRTRAAAEALERKGALAPAEPAAVLAGDAVITMLADDAAVEAVWLVPDLLAKVSASAVHINMTSIGVHLARRLAALHVERGIPYVSAPVFGRPRSAASGELDIVAAGAPDAIARCIPLFEALGRAWFDLGPDPMHANVVKIARNFLLATIIESLGEAFALVRNSGVDPAQFLDVITSTSMNAPAYKNYGRLMLEPPSEVTFPLKLGLKDVELALQAATECAVPLPTAHLIRGQHVAAIECGYAEKDWAALGNYIVDSAAR
jgi:3-hydroxyisobutyrate dehydrogenase-like beta-hydroxyacid dehydrogenase